MNWKEQLNNEFNEKVFMEGTLAGIHFIPGKIQDLESFIATKIIEKLIADIKVVQGEVQQDENQGLLYAGCDKNEAMLQRLRDKWL